MARCSGSNSGASYQNAVVNPPLPPVNRLYYYTTDIKPIIEASCVECHMPGMEMGGLTLDTYTLSGLDHHANLERWIEAYNSIRPSGDMPYGSGPVPSSEQLKIIKAWLDQDIPEAPPVPSVSPTPTPSPSSSPSPSPTPRPSPTPTPTPRPTPTKSPTPTPAPNQPPQMPTMSVSVVASSPTTFFLWASDPNNDPLTFRVTSQPTNGTLGGTPPKLVYSPKAGFSGSDSIKVTVRDPYGAQAQGTVQFQVAPKPKR